MRRRLQVVGLSLAAIAAAFAACTIFVPERRPEGPTAPLVLDLDGDGVELFPGPHVYFDMDLDGYAEKTGWVEADDGLLVLDRDGNGTVDDVSELLGSEGPWKRVELHRSLAEGRLTTGFNLLRQWDDDGNGVIDASDPIFDRLRVWRDLNEDGVSQAEELQGLAQAGVAFLATASTQGIAEDGKNAITDSGEYGRADGSRRNLVSVRFGYDARATKYLGAVTIDPGTEVLPKLDGYGEAKSLSATMSEDEKLRALVTQFTKLTVADAPDLERLTGEILIRWYRADGVDPKSRGPNIDGRIITALERLHGTPWRNGAGSPEPHAKAGCLLIEAWRDNVAYRMVVLLAQIPLGQELFPGLAYKARAFIVLPDDLLLEEALANLRRHSPSDPALKPRYWRSMILALDILYPEFKETVPEAARDQFEGQFATSIDATLAAEGVPYSYHQVRYAMVTDDGTFVLRDDDNFSYPPQ